MIPASLIVVLTITFAISTKRMAERNVIVRKLDSIEALGAVSDICSDKTGNSSSAWVLVRVIDSRGLQALSRKDAWSPGLRGCLRLALGPSAIPLTRSTLPAGGWNFMRDPLRPLHLVRTAEGEGSLGFRAQRCPRSSSVHPSATLRRSSKSTHRWQVMRRARRKFGLRGAIRRRCMSLILFS